MVVLDIKAFENHWYCNCKADVKSTQRLGQCDRIVAETVPNMMEPVPVPQCRIRFLRVPTLVAHASTYRHTQDIRELVCFRLSEAVSCICDKDDW